MSASTPAAPKTIVAAANEWGLEAFFWLRTSEWLRRPRTDHRGNVHEDSQAERDSHVNYIKIYPGDTTVRPGEHLMLSAISFDSNGVPVGGVKYQWQTNSAKNSADVKVSEMGEFVAYAPGVYVVTVQGAGRSAQATMTVGGSDSQSCEGCAANLANEDIYDWNSSNYRWASDPINERGNPLDRAGGAGSGNFQFTAPILSLPGRGLSLDLNLVYNSRVWAKTKVNNVSEMTFDIDKGVPSVGWSFGFNKIINLVDGGAMIVDADGTRHGFSGTVRAGNQGEAAKVFEGSTTDGTLVDYVCYTDYGNSPGVDVARVFYPNGLVVSYGGGLEPSGARVLYPSYIQDSNGNYQTLTYHNHTSPSNFTRRQIKTITDTSGRVVIFHYDSNDLLTAVTAAGIPDANGNPTTRTLIRLHYKQLNLAYAFAPMPTHVRSGTAPVWVIDAIYYPATNTGYWFGDSDSYSSYGMIKKVEQQRGMGFSTSTGSPLNEQGTVTAGLMTNRQLYNYPLVAGDNLTDSPDYTTLTETLEGQTTGPAITTYEVHQEDSPRTVTVTAPDGTRRVQSAHNIPEVTESNAHLNNGLVFKEELYDANNNLMHKTLTNWHVYPWGQSGPPPRADSVEETDERGQMIKTEYSYGHHTNPVTEVREFGYDGNLVRKTVRSYINRGQAGWSNPNARLLNLIQSEKVYAGDGVTLVSHTEYRYDEDPNAYPDFNGCYQGRLVNAPGVINHNTYYNPYGPFGCGITHLFLIGDRGNLTSIVRYPNVNDPASAITETRRYDITGNLVSASTSCCEQTSATYEQATQYAYPVTQSRGSSDPNSLNRVTTNSVYDFNTGLVRSKRDANGQETTISYSQQSWRPQEIVLPTGARITYENDDLEMKVTQTSRLSPNGAIAGQSIKYANGRGNLRQERALAATDVWDIVDTEYDSVNRVSRQTHPYRAGDPQQWTTTTYDALNRVTRVTGPDGSTTESYYNEVDFDPSDGYAPTRPNVASTSAGRTLLVRDAWGRERWGRSNSFGRLVEVVEPNPSGTGSVATGGLTTTYTYNTLGNLTLTNQSGQTRTFKYDSFGRLIAQKLAETSATLNDLGNYVGINGTGAQWSDFFTYDARSNVTTRIDARGVKTIYSYNGDPLNRLQSVSWDLNGPHQELADSPILPAADVTYQYRTKNNPSDLIDVTQIGSVTTAGVSTEGYIYDPEGRVAVESRTINGRPAMEIKYDYDSLDRITYVTYPKRELGVVGSSRKVVHFEYDVASRASLLTVDGQPSASNIVYNAASQTKSQKIGAAGANQITENYEYNLQTGLLSDQNVIRGTDTDHPLLNLSYDYAGANGKRTGQLTKLLNNLNHNKDRSYTYDALGRLIQAKGGQSGSLWTQTYTYDQYGNRTSVTASGSSASLRTGGTGLQSVTAANRITAENPSVLRQMNSESEPGTATGSFGAIAQPSDPRVSLPTDQLSLRTDAPRSASSHHSSRTTPATPQGGPPVFTDPNLLAPGGVIIKTLHITELRTAIDDLRAQRGFSAYPWQTSVTGMIKADPILEMRTALGQVLGPPPAPGYSSGLAALQPILAIHIQELRNRVVAAWNAPVQIPFDGHANLSYDTTTNRITTAGFVYDAAGNQVRALIPGGTGFHRFHYDAANRLVKVKADDNQAVIASYTYGDDNQRLMTEEAGARTYYVAEGLSVIAEYVENGSSTIPASSKSYVYLGARLLSTVTPNGSGGEAVEYHHPDRLGTRLITNPSTGTWFEQQTLPFGTALNESLPTGATFGETNRRFTSYERSGTTKLDYAINRHYDSHQGRFTQVDPIGMGAASLTNPQSLNMYSYCGNDPVNRVDPDGQFWGALFSFFASLFRSLRPNTINVSFRYRNLQPIGFSFSRNLRDLGASYGQFAIQVRSNGTWLPALLGPKNDAFDEAVTAARGILSGDNECSRFFGGAGLNALNGLANAVIAAGGKAYTVLDNVSTGIAMTIPIIVVASSAPVVTTGLYGYVSPMSVAINSRGAFGNMQTSFSATLPRFGGYRPGSIHARVLQLFHETGHLVITDVSRTIYVYGKGKTARIYRDYYRLTHLLPLDGGRGKEGLSEENTERVLKACRSQIDALKN